MKSMLKKISLWCTVITLLMVACLTPGFSQNASAVTVGDAMIYMDNAAKIQEVTNTFKKCLNLQYQIGVSGITRFGNYLSGDFFVNGGINQSNTDISTGAWLEKMVQGKVDDGAIWCKNNDSNIVNVFASTLGTTWQNLVCNGDKPGIMTMQTNVLVNADKGIYQWHNTDVACSVGIGSSDYRFTWVSETDATAHVKRIYEDYRNSHPDEAKYLPSWDDLGNFSDKRVAYFAYLNDFKTACTNGSTYTGDLSLMNQSRYFPAIKEINPSTGILENVYYSRDITKNDWDNSIIGSSGAHTCDTVISKVNEYSDAVAQEAEAIVQAAIEEAEAVARERAKAACKARALYQMVEFDGEGNIVNKINFAGEPSAAYYYLQAKKIIDDPDADRANYIAQLRENIATSNPGLTDADLDQMIAEQESQINENLAARLTRAQSIYDKFDKVLNGAGAGVGDGNKDTSYWYEDGDGSIVCTEFESFDNVITNDSGYQDILDTLLNGATSSVTPTPTIPNGEADACQGVAGSLGWILCPVLNMVSEGVDGIYNNFVQQQFLEVDSAKLDPDTGEGARVYTAWSLIRNIANILFVILFMIVLFSQFTGIGLTNYSIKKMLPKLIMVAILVNISFLLCQFAVDVSNVLGYSLNSMFDSMSGAITGLGGSFNESSTLINWVSTLGLIVGTLSIGSWLPAFLLVLLSAAISVFFGAIILGARLAGVYILVVLAPVAIVCYALPNSKKIFDRWLKIFTSLLLVFPICGALMGGGNFASSILLGSDPYTSPNVFLILVAMLLRVVPFFLIPGLVRSSMSALGNVGAKISSIGNRMGGSITGAARKSDRFQRISETGEQLRARGVNLRHKAYGKLTGGKFTGRKSSKRRVARAISTQEARIRGDAKAGAIASGGFISRGRAKDIMSSALDTEETQGIKDAENGYRLDQNFDANNSGSVSKELEKRLNELQKHPDNVEVRRKVKALTKILLETDDGRGALTETVQKFAEANQGSKASQILGKYLNTGENMGIIKGKNQRGLQKLAQDINNGAPIQSLAKYNAMGAGKIGAGAVGGLDESFLKAQVAAANSGILNGKALQDLADTYTRALTSENAANEIPPELVGYLNDIRQKAHIASGGTMADFNKLHAGDTLPIPHATMPAGWRYNNTARRWEDGHGVELSREDTIKAEEISKHNARADIDNS